MPISETMQCPHLGPGRAGRVSNPKERKMTEHDLATQRMKDSENEQPQTSGLEGLVLLVGVLTLFLFFIYKIPVWLNPCVYGCG